MSPLEQYLVDKITSISKDIDDSCIIKANEFDKDFIHTNSYLDPSGAAWNPYVHENCLDHGVEIWKDKRRHNFYVKSSEACINEASKLGLNPHTTDSLYRGNKR